MAREALLFDLDGTLVDSLPDIQASANHIRRRFHLPEVDLEEVKAMVGDGMLILVSRALAHGAPHEPTPEQVQEGVFLYKQHYAQQCTKLVQLYPGVREWLQRWHAEGRPMAVVTNKPKVFTEKIVKHLGLSPYLPVLIGGDSLPQKKPNPKPLQHAMQLLGNPPGGIMVGDSVSDIRAGKAAGLRTAAVTFGYRREEELLRAEADEYWPRFGEPEVRAAHKNGN